MKEKISNIEFSGLMIMILVASFLGVGIFISIKTAGVDSYLCIIVSFILGLYILFLFRNIFNYEPDLPIYQKLEKLFGKKVGLIFNFLFIINTLMFCISMLYDLTNFIVSQFLQQTPDIVIIIPFALLICYLCTKGIQNISRTTFILVILNIILLIIALISLVPQIKASNLMPSLEHGIFPPLKGGAYITLFNILPLYLLLAIPKNNIVQSEKNKKYFFVTYTLSLFIMFLIILTTMGNLGVHLSSIYQYPEYMVLKRINFFNFINRIENIINIQWIFGLYILLTLGIFYINSFVNKKNRKIIPYFIISIVILLSFIFFKNIVIFNTYIQKYLIYTRIIFVFLFSICGFAPLIKKKKSF